MLSPSDDEMIKSCLSINISVTFILSAPPGAGLDSEISVQYFNKVLSLSLSLSAEISYQMLNFSDFKILRLKVNLTVRAPGRYWPQQT